MSAAGDSHREDLAPFLLGALTEEGARELERHLAGCESCREQLEWLRPAAHLLGESVEQLDPPRGLRGRVLAAAREEAAAGVAAPEAARRARLRPWARRRPLAALAGVAALALAAAAIGGYALGGGGGGENEATLASAGRAPGMTATLMRKGDAGMLRLANVEPMPDGHVLEAWVRRRGRVTPVRGLFMPDRSGRAVTMIPDVGGVEAVMVTAEPRGGSPAPTSAPLVTLAVAQRP